MPGLYQYKGSDSCMRLFQSKRKALFCLYHQEIPISGKKSMKRPDFSAVNENTVVMNKEAGLHVVTHTLIVLSDEPLNSQSP